MSPLAPGLPEIPWSILTTEARAHAWATDTLIGVRSPPVKKGSRAHQAPKTNN